jgi:xanthine/uracil permease
MRAAWMAMELTGWYAVAPLAVGSLVTGVVMALGTRWGLFRYFWVLFAFALTTVATIVLLLHLPTVSSMADTARVAGGARLREMGGDLLHPGVGLVVLLGILVLNVYKPPGMTRYGWRKQQEERRAQASRGPAVKP